jgi:hypothetical protein
MRPKYTRPKAGERRTVTVPLHDRVRIGTFQRIADQCGADDFRARYEWMDEHRGVLTTSRAWTV